ncbi:MAG: AAA family ATPase, partial [Lachnospiraceae bacterium]|nr:AAA family ATPase [Lachnospiraceae bacterium]
SLSDNTADDNEPRSDNYRQVYHSLYYYTELGIAKMLHEIDLKGRVPEEKILERIHKVEKKSGITLDEMQKEAVIQAANSGILVITGGPGTGKTTTINAIIKYFEQDYKEILLAAPTGRAAKRMTEATGWEAKTIHRMLDLSGELEDTSAGARFDRNEDNPLEADVVIIDEMSMVDMFLMSALLRAIEPGTRLILVGDVDQLPSVGPGNVLRDIIDSDCFKTVKLTKIFRQAEESDIVVNAHKINRGEQIALRPDSRDFIFIKRETAQAVLSAVLGLVRDKLPGYVDTDASEIQVLSPVKKGPLGVEHINQFLQESLNPSAPGKEEIPVGAVTFREGDKVMHIKNNYELEWEMRTNSGFVYEQGKGIFNGDIGVIQKINPHTRLMEVRFDDGKFVIYDFEQLEEVVLAYATTIHKAQGSEYPAVVLPLLSGPELLMNRNILYTAVTRAKKCVCITGSDAAVTRMINNVREQKRYSGLKERILEFKGRVL